MFKVSEVRYMTLKNVEEKYLGHCLREDSPIEQATN